ncbi:MAG: IS21 family transposase [Phocaeicola sp.]
MTQRQEIIKMLRDGRSIRSISREMSCDRKTVRRYLNEYEKALASEDSSAAVLELIHTKPTYQVANRTCRRFSKFIQDRVDHYFEVNRKLRRQGLRKQCMTGKQIHRKLVEEGLEISYSTVCNYLLHKRVEDSKAPMSKECFLRIHYEPGQIVEFDWGEVTLYIAGKKMRFYMAVFTFAYSNARYTYLFRHQDQLAFMESHRNFFREVNGVPYCMVYDNMRVAVKEFVGTERKVTDTLAGMSSFYGFSYRFCNIRSGNEKGHVENSVKVVRSRGFSGEDIYFNTIELAQKHASQICSVLNREGQTKEISVLEDCQALKIKEGDFGCFVLQEYKVDKWSTVYVKNSHYSVPDHLVGKSVSVRLYSEKVAVFYKQEKITTHQRSYTNDDCVVDITHYLPTLLNKPNALTHTQAWHNASDKLRKIYKNRFCGTDKEFVQLMVFISENGYTIADLEEKSKELYGRNVRKATKDQLTAMLLNKEQDVILENTPMEPFKEQEILIEQRAGDSLEGITAIMGTNTHLNTLRI